jgi:hypothetical protein
VELYPCSLVYAFTVQAGTTSPYLVTTCEFASKKAERRQSRNANKFIKKEINIYHFIIPTNAHNLKNVDLLKHIKIMKAAPTCFGLQRNHHQGVSAST